MSKCTACLQRMCKKHPLQDHGERTAKLLQKATDAKRSSMDVTSILKSQINKLESQSLGTSSLENELYRGGLEKEREEKRKGTSSSNKNLAKYAGSSLNPSVLSMMIAESDDDATSSTDKREHRKRKHRDDDNDGDVDLNGLSDDNLGTKKRHKKQNSKKHKKKEKSKDKSKKRKKEKKAKKSSSKDSKRRKKDEEDENQSVGGDSASTSSSSTSAS
mmetsp:Transcript_14234/g.23691  ORF Transcript_14234/g.23691 Transcript_14234/m.23691 type:complete len:217 (-) Transcript_14234:107-757(-)